MRLIHATYQKVLDLLQCLDVMGMCYKISKTWRVKGWCQHPWHNHDFVSSFISVTLVKSKWNIYHLNNMACWGNYNIKHAPFLHCWYWPLLGKSLYYSRQIGQYHGCWCHGDLCHHGISSHGIDCVRYVDHCFLWGTILSVCVILMRRNDGKLHLTMYILQNISVCKGLILFVLLVTDAAWCHATAKGQVMWRICDLFVSVVSLILE